MSDWEEQLSSILGDPEQMNRIAEMAKTLMGGGEEPVPPTGGKTEGNSIAELARSLMGGRDDKQALLEAMKPWLSEKRRRKMDRAMQIARMAKLAELTMGEQGGGDV